ncbi:PBS lyase HEAT domain protein repeat-containing protein [Candidatus Magnetoovum chiemensis]|nr:PBS lyase HEAT domain protein repeat-containing protein [Candidatus Magnetoovum chiemensis]
MFEGRKIKKLIAKYSLAAGEKEENKLINEIKTFEKIAFHYSIEAFKKRELTPAKGQMLIEALSDADNIEEILPLIGDTYDEIRRVVKEIVAKKWKTKSIPYLIDLLNSSDHYLRTNATELLCLFKDKTYVSKLVSMFNRGDEELKKNIIKIIAEIADEMSIRFLISALNDDSSVVRIWAIRTLGKLKDPSSVEPLIERLKEGDTQTKIVTLDSLGAIGDKRSAAAMLQMLKDNDLLIRQKASDYIMKIADSEIIPNIVGLMADEDVNVRRGAVEILNNIKDPRAGSSLLKAMKDSDWWVRQIATDALSEMKGDNILPYFLNMLTDKDESMRRCAVEFFNKVQEPSAYDPLVKLLDDDDWWVREKALTALSKLHDKRAIEHIVGKIADDEIKTIVPNALAEIGDKEAIKYLTEFLLDGDNKVRIESIKALGKLKAYDAVSEIKELLNDQDEDIKTEAINALKAITGRTYKALSIEKESSHSQPTSPYHSRTSHQDGAILSEAILVLDLCNSTGIADKYGNNFALQLTNILADVVNPIAKRERFQFIKSTGDGYLITFPRVVNAVNFAVDVLKQIDKHNKTAKDSQSIDLRFAINQGETRVDSKGDRLSIAVNMTFRVEGVKPEGLISIEGCMKKEEMPLVNRIFITENVIHEVQHIDNIQTRLVGLFELKGITGLHKIYELKPKELQLRDT